MRYLEGRGVPAHRLATAGFVEFRPLEPGDAPEIYRHNRRIERDVRDQVPGFRSLLNPGP